MADLTPALLIVGTVNLVMFPLILWAIKRWLEKFDAKRDRARAERAEDERRKTEQREAEHGIVLAIARTMLLDNYEKCMAKGYYSREEREVFSLMYHEYKLSDGNGVIDTIAEHIRELPMEPPKKEG